MSDSSKPRVVIPSDDPVQISDSPRLDQLRLVAEVEIFHDCPATDEEKLRRAANLNLTPDLNDGVVLNITPLWELVPWKEAQKYWEQLLEGYFSASRSA